MARTDVTEIRDRIKATWQSIQPWIEQMADLSKAMTHESLATLITGPLHEIYLADIDERRVMAECEIEEKLASLITEPAGVSGSTEDLLSAVESLKGSLPSIDEDTLATLPQSELAEIWNVYGSQVVLMAKVYLHFVYNLTCTANYGCTMWHLHELAKEGDEESLLRLLRIDKSAVSIPWINAEIRTRQLKADWAFLERLGRAIATEPRPQIGYLAPELCMVAMFWNEGLSDLTWPRIHEIFQELELSPKRENFKAFHERMIRAGFKKARYNRK